MYSSFDKMTATATTTVYRALAIIVNDVFSTPELLQPSVGVVFSPHTRTHKRAHARTHAQARAHPSPVVSVAFLRKVSRAPAIRRRRRVASAPRSLYRRRRARALGGGPREKRPREGKKPRRSNATRVPVRGHTSVFY